MPLGIYDKIIPKGDFNVTEAKYIGMEDGTTVEETVKNAGLMAELEGTAILKPEKYYVFGEVSALSVTLEETDDGNVHEYCFEFTPTEDFTELEVLPEVKWVTTPQYVTGKTCQVSIMRGIGVMIRA